MTESNKAPSFNLKGPGNFTGNKKDWETWAFRFANYAKNIDFRLRATRAQAKHKRTFTFSLLVCLTCLFDL